MKKYKYEEICLSITLFNYSIMYNMCQNVTTSLINSNTQKHNSGLKGDKRFFWNQILVATAQEHRLSNPQVFLLLKLFEMRKPTLILDLFGWLVGWWFLLFVFYFIF